MRCELQDRTHLLAREPVIGLDQLVHCHAIFKVLENHGNGHAGTLKDPCSANLIRDAFDGIALRPIQQHNSIVACSITRGCGLDIIAGGEVSAIGVVEHQGTDTRFRLHHHAFR